MESSQLFNDISSSGESDNSDDSINPKDNKKINQKLIIDESEQIEQHNKELKDNLDRLLQRAENYASFLFCKDQESSEESDKISRRKRKKKVEKDIISDMSDQQRVIRISKQPGILKNGILRPYQVDGIN